MNKSHSLRISWRKILYFAGIGLGLILFLQQIWRGFQAVQLQMFQQVYPLLLLAAVGMTILAYALQMIAWAQIMQGLGDSISLTTVLHGYVISFLPRYIPGTVWGYLGRNEWLRTNLGISYTKSTMSSILEVGMTLLTAGVISLSYSLWYLWSGAIHPVIIMGNLLVPGMIWLGLKMTLKFSPARLLKDKLSFLTNFSFCRISIIYLIYLLMWSCHGLSLVFILSAFNYGIESHILQTTAIFSFSWLVGFVVLIVPSGLGVREVALSNLLTLQMSLTNISASMIALLARLAIYIAEIAWLCFGLLIIKPK